MSNESGVIIANQTFGEALTRGQVAYLKSDGKWWKAQANAETTSTGDIGIPLDTGTSGRILKLGYIEVSTWNWIPGSPVYLSATSAGGLTQTRPGGAGTVVRVIGYPTTPTVLYLDPGSPLTLATVEGLTATKGDLIVGQAGAWTTFPVSTDPWAQIHPNPAKTAGLAWRPEVPDLLNRVVYETDAAENILEIHQVYIPRFVTQGLPDANLNGILCGDIWVDKYLACQPDASNVSRGTISPNSPETNGAASKPHVVPWTDINWSNAKLAIENRGGANNHKTGNCVQFGTGSASAFYVANISDLIGKRVYITQSGVKYVRRIVRTGGNVDADPNAAKFVEIYPALPAPITAADTYEILHYYLPGGKEWFDLWAWAHMNRYQHSLGWPKGNTNWGKFHEDPRAQVYEGLPDPVRPGYSGNAIARTLTGSGPLSWSLNGKESGIRDLVGNCWEWGDLLATDNVIDPVYPGAGTVLPTTNGNIASLYAPNRDGEYSIGAEVFAPATLGSANAEYDTAYYWQATGQRAAERGGYWNLGAGCSLACLYLHNAPSYTHTSIGFRGVC